MVLVNGKGMPSIIQKPTFETWGYSVFESCIYSTVNPGGPGEYICGCLHKKPFPRRKFPKKEVTFKEEAGELKAIVNVLAELKLDENINLNYVNREVGLQTADTCGKCKSHVRTNEFKTRYDAPEINLIVDALKNKEPFP